MGKSAHKGHRERLRQRALMTRLEQMPAHEVIELLLTYAIPLRDVNDLAHDIVEKFGTVGQVLHASQEALMEVKGVGQSTAEFLTLVGHVLDEYVDSTEKKPAYTTARKLANLLGAVALKDGYYVACMDARNRLQQLTPLRADTSDAREMALGIVETAIKNHSYNVVLMKKGGMAFDRVDYGILPAFLELGQDLEIGYLDEMMKCDSGEMRSMLAEQKGKKGLKDPAATAWLEDWRIDEETEGLR